MTPEIEEEWYEYWNEESKHTEQKYLTPDTHGIIRDFIRTKLDEAYRKGREDREEELFKACDDDYDAGEVSKEV